MTADEDFAQPDPDALGREADALGLAGGAAPPGEADDVLAGRSEALMRIDGVVMVGLGSTGIGDPAILVGVRRADQLAALPAALDGLPVYGQVIGDVEAL